MITVSEHIILFIILCYVWYSFQIKIEYIFLFLIVVLIFVYRYFIQYRSNTNEENTVTMMYENNNFDSKVPITVAKHINDNMIQFRKYNESVFDKFITRLNKYYYETEDINKMSLIVNTFREISYSLPVEESFIHYEALCKFCVLTNYNSEFVDTQLNNYSE